MYDANWALARKAFARAIELKPAYITTYYWFSSCLLAMGLGKEALAADHQALEKDPLSVLANAHLAWTFVGLGEYEKAIEQSQKALELDENFGIAHRLLGQSYSQLGRHQQAIAAFRRSAELSNRSPSLLAWLAYAHGLAGDTSAAEKIFEEMIIRSEQEFVRSYLFALASVGLGRMDQAVRYLEKSCQEHDFWLPWLHLDAALRPLQKSQRFQDLSTRILRQMANSPKNGENQASVDRADLTEPSLPPAATVGRPGLTIVS
jgi:tetratricopeptide (TPR) repeat protein